MPSVADPSVIKKLIGRADSVEILEAMYIIGGFWLANSTNAPSVYSASYPNVTFSDVRTSRRTLRIFMKDIMILVMMFGFPLRAARELVPPSLIKFYQERVLPLQKKPKEAVVGSQSFFYTTIWNDPSYTVYAPIDMVQEMEIQRAVYDILLEVRTKRFIKALVSFIRSAPRGDTLADFMAVAKETREISKNTVVVMRVFDNIRVFSAAYNWTPDSVVAIVPKSLIKLFVEKVAPHISSQTDVSRTKFWFDLWEYINCTT